MVRRPSALLIGRRPASATLALGVSLLALAYFLAAPALPSLPQGDATIAVAGGLGLLIVAATTLALLPAREALAGLLLVGLVAGLLTVALDLGGVGAGANVAEALLAAAIGLLFARLLDAPVAAVAVALFVAAVDVWSFASGPTALLLAAGTDTADPLSFDLPAWGDAGSAGHVGLSDAVFVAMFAAWAWRHGFRRAATIAGLALGLIASLGLGLALDRAIPALPLIAAGYLLPNADRAWRLVKIGR